MGVSDLLFLLLALVVVAAGTVVRRRLRARRSRLTDDMVRRIEREGRIDAEDVDPLDLERIRAEEDEFWSQTWDEPEPL